MSKKYGLIVPDKNKLQPTFQASRNVFGNDSESDDDSNKKPVLLRPSDNINRLAKVAQTKAIFEDPTVFQYDEVYDTMKSEKKGKKEKVKEEKKPKYIENLLKSANKRKIENERRIERQIQKEREQEGDEFADKEVFVTSAYKKKLEEMSLEEEKEKREEYLESIGDVTKQRDLGGFYRHLYEQKLGFEKKIEKNHNEKDNAIKICSDLKQHDSDRDEFKEELKTKQHKDNIPEASKKRNYRKRKTSSDVNKQLSEGEIDESDEEINRLNLDDIRMAKKSKQDKENIDADSDFSIDESSEDDDTEKKDQKKLDNEDEFKKPEVPQVSLKETKSVDVSNELQQVNKTNEPKPKIDIWKKRTVGAVFDHALKRYYERKASRSV